MRHKTQLLITSAILATLSFQSAKAAEPGNARFHFAPNVWRNESTRMPEPEYAVKNGSVPVGSKFLGLDPEMLAKPPKPIAQVAARPSFMQVTPQMLPPAFNASFGKPQMPPAAAEPAKVAHIQPLKAKHAIAHAPVRRTTAVAGKLMHKVVPQEPALAAIPDKGIASYGKDFGYVPGAFVPGQASDGLTRQSNVQGRLLR